jgi:hypothetical protein
VKIVTNLRNHVLNGALFKLSLERLDRVEARPLIFKIRGELNHQEFLRRVLSEVLAHILQKEFPLAAVGGCEPEGLSG